AEQQRQTHLSPCCGVLCGNAPLSAFDGPRPIVQQRLLSRGNNEEIAPAIRKPSAVKTSKRSLNATASFWGKALEQRRIESLAQRQDLAQTKFLQPARVGMCTIA